MKPKDQLLQAFADAAESSHGGVYRLAGVTVTVGSGDGTPFDFGDDAVYLAGIRAMETGLGKGGQAMQVLTTLADRYKVAIVLHAVGQKDGPPLIKLERFFQKHGFENTGPNREMTRESGPAKDAAPPQP